MGIHFTLLMLSALGLGALYMLHLLAQDFNKIRQPIASTVTRFLISKREINAVNSEEITFYKIDWDRILKYDLLNCSLSLICQLSSGAEKNNNEAKKINELVQYSVNIGAAPDYINKAYFFGINYTNNCRRCYKLYSLCPYSLKTMLKILQIYSKLHE